MMGLLSSRLDLDNQKYILVLHALELLANETNDHLQTVAGFLLSSSFDEVCPTYRKNDIGTIVYDDDGYAGTFQKTWEILKYFHTTSPHHFYESNYRENYWSRSEFFSFLIEHKITNIPSVIDWIAKNPTSTQTDEIEQQTAILQRDPLLTNLDIFSIVEASCLISGDNPIQVNICSNDTNFWQTYDKYLKAESFISAGIKSGRLDSDITRQSLQKYLLEKSYVIEGFNDNLPPVTADKIGHATITQTMPTDSQLSQQVADQQATIDQQAKEIAELKAQLASVEAGKDNQSKDNERPNVISVKVNDETAQILNTLADEQGITVGECLRNAVLEMLELYELYEKLADPNSDKYSEQGQKLIEYIKSNVPDPEKLYSLLKKANVLPIEQASNDTQSNDKLLSNVELNNLKKAVIAENNRQIATILKSMDLRGELSKDDLLQVIRPNMESMAKVLNGENSYKALLVVDNTIKDNHLKSLSFQTGRKTKEQTEKKSIQLIFDREKPPITEN